MNRRKLRQPAAVALLVLGVMFSVMSARVHAGGATLPPAQIAVHAIAPGVTAEVFAAAPSALAPGQTVYNVRFVYQPGAALTPRGEPGTTVLGVVSGLLDWRLQSGAAHVERAAASFSPGQTDDLIIPGSDVVLGPGDAISYESDTVAITRAAGDTAAVVAGSLVLKSDVPLMTLIRGDSAESMPGMDMSGMDMTATAP
jgi:hypothetical protein